MLIFRVLLLLAIISIGNLAFAQPIISDRSKPPISGMFYDRYEIYKREPSGKFVAADSNNLAGFEYVNGFITISKDGGRNWKEVYRNPPPNFGENLYNSYITNIVYPSQNLIIAIGGKGRIIRSTDAGTTWEVKSSGDTTPLMNISMLDSNRGVLGRLQNGTLRRTTDGGNTWTNMNVPDSIIPKPSGMSNLVYRKEGSILFTMAWNKAKWLFRTEDDGKTWTRISYPNFDVAGNDLFKQTADTLYGIQVGFISSNPDSAKDYRAYDRVIRTTDGGETWHYILNGRYYPEWGVSDITMWGSNGIISGDAVKIYCTFDGGETWIRDDISPFYQEFVKGGAGFGYPVLVSKNLLYVYNDIDGNGQQNFIRMYLKDPTTGVSDLNTQESEGLQIFPNPAQDKIQVRFSGNSVEYFIVDLLGREVLHTQSQGEITEISTVTLSNGVYLLKGKEGNRAKTTRFSIFR